jgi:hypothetical protein
MASLANLGRNIKGQIFNGAIDFKPRAMILRKPLIGLESFLALEGRRSLVFDERDQPSAVSCQLSAKTKIKKRLAEC